MVTLDPVKHILSYESRTSYGGGTNVRYSVNGICRVTYIFLFLGFYHNDCFSIAENYSSLFLPLLHGCEEMAVNISGFI